MNLVYEKNLFLKKKNQENPQNTVQALAVLYAVSSGLLL